MNRQEALTRLRLRSHQAFCEYVENGNQENEEAALDVLAYDMALAALRGPQPDPITGLVPCGCGGKACLWERKSGRGWLVDCLKCDMGTNADELSKAEAKAMWNTAMGWKGGAE